MKLISLKLLHFRRFRQEEIIFKNDFSLIFWKNWAWKSSLLDAIWYAFFGPSSKDFIRVNTQLLKSHFLKDREPSKIELTFQHWLDTYRIIRIIDAWIKKLSNDFIPETKDSLFWPNNLEIIGWSEVTSFLITLLWVSRDTFLRSIFAKQKDLEVLSGWKEERKVLINSILWLDKLEFIIWNIKNNQKDKKQLLEFIKKQIFEFDLESITNKKEEITENLKIKKQQLDIIEKEKNDLNLSFNSVKNDFEIINNNKNIFNTLTQKQSLKNQNILNINKNIIEKTTLLEQITVYEKYLKENEFIIKLENDLKNSLLNLQTKKQNFLQKDLLEKEIKNQEAEKEDILKKLSQIIILKSLEDLNKEIEKESLELKNIFQIKSAFEADLNSIKTEWEKLSKELENIEKLWIESDCPTCKRALKEHFPNLVWLYNDKINEKRKIYKEKNNELKEQVLKLEDKEKLISSLKTEKQKIETEEKQIIILKQKLENITSNIALNKEKLKNIWNVEYSIQEHEKIEIDYQKAKNDLSNYNKILWQVEQKEKVILVINSEKTSLEKETLELNEINESLLNLDFKNENYESIKKSYDEIYTKKDEKSNEYNNQYKIKLDLESKLENILKQISDFENQKKEIDILITEIDYLDIKKQVISDYIIYLLNNLKPSIEYLASSYFAIITDNKYSQITIDDDYNIMIDQKSIDLYSWWERDLANLCLRLSLWQSITNKNWNSINFLILDEVLASQDKERQQNILINLKKLENKFSQIILISHLEEIKDLASNLIEVRSKNFQESEIVYY